MQEFLWKFLGNKTGILGGETEKKILGGKQRILGEKRNFWDAVTGLGTWRDSNPRPRGSEGSAKPRPRRNLIGAEGRGRGLGQEATPTESGNLGNSQILRHGAGILRHSREKNKKLGWVRKCGNFSGENLGFFVEKSGDFGGKNGNFWGKKWEFWGGN